MQFITPLFELGKNDLAVAGGKGANLSALLQANFPVPPGFVITTAAYRNFVAANELQAVIQRTLAAADCADPASLETASAAIRAAFAASQIPASLQSEICSQLAAVSSQLSAIGIQQSKIKIQQFAIRSSATAEDLPGLSFAGQQDTYLNVVGETDLLQAIVKCWSSLWTARAIGYRARKHISQNDLALAVVVQQMIPSQVSGVLFTANPLSGLRTETVIDATFGLGEALVSGQVEPDQYVIEPVRQQIISKKLGAKALSLHTLPGGGADTIQQDRRTIQALPDMNILELAALSRRIEQLFGEPQDIEWAWADDRLYILQSRPITSLFPLPTNLSPEPLKVLFSFGAVQGLFAPLTPLGIDALKLIFAAGAGLFGIRVTAETQNVLFAAGERLWVNFTPILRNSVGRRIVPSVLALVEPTIRQAVEQIWDDPRLQPGRPGISFHARTQLARFAVRLIPNIILNLIAPRQRRAYIVNNGEKILAQTEARCTAIQGDRWQKLDQRAALLPEIAARHLHKAFVLFVSGVASGMASWNLLNLLSAGDIPTQPSGAQPHPHDLVLRVTRGMPYNPTTEMDLALWEMARTIRSDPASFQAFQANDVAWLSAAYLAGDLPPAASDAVRRFLGRYGGRGLGEIDLGRTRWAEDPIHVFEMLSSFLQIDDESLAPDVMFARGAESAQQAIDELAQAVRNTRHGWLRARLVRFFAGRTRQLMGMRENPKFFAVRMMWIVHRELLKSGQEFVAAGELDRLDDLFWMSLAELNAFAARQARDWRSLIAARREANQRELQRRQIPRLLMSDGRAFYEGMRSPETAEDTIVGSPVSPGNIQGWVRVVLDPRQANLQPGEILVCPGTDPSWTPLFLSAGGLVMETGGMMTHGAVVAREYGIPAVVGVDCATIRLKTGQLIQMDGSSGLIQILP